MKKIFIISIILLFIVLFFLGIYNFAFKKKEVATQIPSQTQNVSQKNQSSGTNTTATQDKVSSLSQAKLTAITKNKVLSASFDKKNNIITYYSAQDGTTWSVGPEGNNEQILENTVLQNLHNVQWSPDHNKTLTTFEKDGQISFYEYDVNSKKAIALKSGLDNAVWDNLGAKIFYKYFDSKNKSRTLNIANPDGTNWQKIADVSARNLSIAQVPLSSTVSFWNSPDSNELTQLQTVNVTGSDLKTLFDGRYGADYLWSPNGSQALVSFVVSKGGKDMSLGTISRDGTYHDLALSTFVSKCTWSLDNKNIYCAMPSNIPDGTMMPNDYQNGKITTNDTFWKIDTSTGEKKQLGKSEQATGAYDAKNIFLSPTEDNLYFINKIDRKLYKLSL